MSGKTKFVEKRTVGTFRRCLGKRDGAPPQKQHTQCACVEATTETMHLPEIAKCAVALRDRKKGRRASEMEGERSR